MAQLGVELREGSQGRHSQKGEKGLGLTERSGKAASRCQGRAALKENEKPEA